MTLSRIKSLFKQLIYLPEDVPIEVMLATVVANQLPGDALFLHIVGYPSSGKTELLKSMKGCKKTYHLSKITPAAMLSGYQQKKNTKKSHDKSLLIRMKESGKNVMVFKDFTVMLSIRSEYQNEIMSLLRDIYDGDSNLAFGMGEDSGWEGKIGIISGVTPDVIERVSDYNHKMGERFLFIRVPLVPDDCDDASTIVKRPEGDRGSLRNEIRNEVIHFLDTLPIKDCDHQYDYLIEKLSKLVSMCRASVPRDRFHKIDGLPGYEGYTRIYGQLSSLAKGLVNIGSPDPEKSLRQVAFDTIPHIRFMILRHLWVNHFFNSRTIVSLSKDLDLPFQVVQFALEDMAYIGLLKEREIISIKSGKTRKGYKIAQKIGVLMEETKVYEPNEEEIRAMYNFDYKG